VEEVSRHLGVAKDSIYRWISRKGLPAHKIGKLWKFKKVEVDGWVRLGGASISETDADTARLRDDEETPSVLQFHGSQQEEGS